MLGVDFPQLLIVRENLYEQRVDSHQHWFKPHEEEEVSWIHTRGVSLALLDVPSRGLRESRCKAPELMAAELFSGIPPVDARTLLRSLLVSSVVTANSCCIAHGIL